MNTHSLALCLPTVKECGWILRRSIDQEMILAWKLGFHYFTGAMEANRLCGEKVLKDELGRALGFCLTRGACGQDDFWFIPIKPEDQMLFGILLPEKGPLFKSSDPYGRLVRMAEAHNIRLTPKLIQRACLTYAMASGMYVDQVAQLAGIRSNRSLGHLIHPISRGEAREFCELSVDLKWAASLPRYQRNLRQN